MEVIAGAWWLICQIGDAIFYFWPISLIFLLLLALGVILGGRDRAFVAVSTRLVMMLAIVVAAFVVLSLVLWREPARHSSEPIAWGAYVVTGVFLIHGVISVWIVVRSRPRLYLIPVVLATLWVSLCSWFISFLSVSGAASL